MNRNMLLFSSMFAQYAAFIQQLDKQEVNTEFLNKCVGWMYKILHTFLLCSRQKKQTVKTALCLNLQCS